MEKLFTIICRCGLHRDLKAENILTAEVEAELHEAQDYRRPYRHSTSIVEVKVA